MKKNKSNALKALSDFKYCLIFLAITGCFFYFKTTLLSAIFFGMAIGCTLLFLLVYISGKKALEKAAERIDKKISIQRSTFEKN